MLDKGIDQPGVKPLGLAQVLARGALLEQMPEGTNLPSNVLRTHGRRIASHADPGDAEQDLDAIREQDRIDDDRGCGYLVDVLEALLQRVDTVVLEVVAR